ncbi:methyltransferase domain-containing protein [Streptomyces europaeiscabiei]|uniref:methyltransferase domain-containing protein n=1 Tax=Streptomyces europaeiscabiei TaxID=146819 RepID=UPI0029B1125F|nr:methyltransferase domain-containing protein [Streptomyces europaeiscabiei]MDX3694773.1 methyltransferase domain-containing protein [Streptomyces europaeiscabiei]
MHERDDEQFATLLEGAPYDHVGRTGSGDEAATVAGQISCRLAIPAPSNFPRLQDQAGAWEKHLRQQMAEMPHALDPKIVDAVVATVRDLAQDQPAILVHGDLNARNILPAVREPWLAVDPKGWSGDPAYDCGRLIKSRSVDAPMTNRPLTTAAPAASPPGPHTVAAEFDTWHTARAGAPLIARLYAEAMGERYPHEVAANSSCDWPLLRLLIARLQMTPGQFLVDAGCGTGGVGLWLARALSVRLAGIDVSAAAIGQATDRTAGFVPANRAAFRVARLEATGLPDDCAHAVVCVDALGFATDRTQALRELGRVLAPGGRLALTRAVRRDTAPDFHEHAQAAGLVLEHVDERPDEPATWERVFRLWIRHADALRGELGDAEAQKMLTTATRRLPLLPGRRAVLLTLRRPATGRSAAPVPDTMTGPGHPDGGRVPDERTKQ